MTVDEQNFKGEKAFNNNMGGDPTIVSNYIYDEDYENEVCNKTDIARLEYIAIPLFFSLVIILSLFGNILVLVILAMYENIKTPTNTFILNLALSDLLFTLGLPFWAFYHVWGWTLGEPCCKAVNFIFYAGFYSSILFLMVMTIHRYLAVVHPLSDRGENRIGNAFSASLIVWMVSFAAAIPALLHSTVQKDPQVNMLHCEYDDINWKNSGIYQQNIFFFIAFSTMGFCYARILQTISRSRSNRRTRTVKLILTIVVVFFVGWAPYNVVMFLRSLTDFQVFPFNECHVNRGLEYAFLACRLIAFVHCCLNPVFYVFVGVKFRYHLKVILQRLQRLYQHQTSMDSQRTRMATLHSQGSMY